MLTTKTTSLEAELVVARANPLPGFEVLSIRLQALRPRPAHCRLVQDRNARTVPTVDGTGVINYHTMMGEVIRSFGRDDWVNFKPLLLKFLRLFGEAILESLTRTCSDQLSHLTGCYSAEGAEAWMRAKAPDLLNENDLAETPFAKVPLI